MLQSFHRNFRAVFVTQVLGAIIFFAVLMTQVLPVIVPEFSVKPFVNEFKQHYDGQAPVYIEKFYRPGFMYYSSIAGTELSREHLATIAAGKSGRAYVIMKKTKYEKLLPAMQHKFRLLAGQEDKILLLHENK